MAILKYKSKKSDSKPIVDPLDLSKVDSEFRVLVDLLFFTDRTDVNLLTFKDYIKKHNNFKYFEDRFDKSTQIFWSAEFWNHRIQSLLLLKNKRITKFIENKIEKNFLHLLSNSYKININNDVSFVQYIEFCKVKNKHNLSVHLLRQNFINICSYANIKKVLYIGDIVVPALFSSYEEYVKYLFLDIKFSNKNLKILHALRNRGIQVHIHLMNEITILMLSNRLRTSKERRLLFDLIAFPGISDYLKANWNSDLKNGLMESIKITNFYELDQNHFETIKRIINIDSSLTEDLCIIYLDKLYSRYTTHKKANIDKINKFIKNFPQVSPKKILSWLSSTNKNYEIKLLFKEFPDLNKLALFV